MKRACKEWKNQLLEAALTGLPTKDLERHLQSCAACLTELRELEERRGRLDALLPMVARGAEPSSNLRAQVLAAAETARQRKHGFSWRAWTLGGTVAAALVIGAVWLREAGQRSRDNKLAIASAQRLAEWRAPSDSLLATPGREILQTTPKLGESYLHVPVNRVKEEIR